VEWDGTNDAGRGVAAGIYFYQLRAVDFVATRKMVLLDGYAGSSRSSQPRKTNIIFNTENADLFITIEASSPKTHFYQKQHLQVFSNIIQFNFSVRLLPDLINPSNITISEIIEKQYVYIGGKPGSIKPTMDRVETVQIINHRLNYSKKVVLNRDKSFPLIQMLAQKGDQLSVALFCEGNPVSVPRELIIPNTAAPQVFKSKPTNGDKDIIVDVVIQVYFSEPIELASVNGNSFYLLDSLNNVVPGTIGFLGDTVALLTPSQPLEYYSEYTIIVTTEVHDLQDIPMEEPFWATFRTKAQQILLSKYYGNPIMSSGSYPAWDAAYIASPSVVYDDDQYHMFYNGNNPFLYNWAIGHATSSDGITWTKDSLNNPVLTAGSPGSWDDESVLVSSVLIYGSTFHLWYTGAQTGNIYWKIGYAWSTDNGITWTKWDDPSTTNPPYAESDPVLDVGSPVSWDRRTVKSPHVILENDIFKMWYVGNISTYGQSIGYAWSHDGIEWTKDTLHNPVLTPGTSYCWDVRGVDEPCVVFDGAFYHMFYMGGLMYTDHQIGYAWSADGINWEKYDNPYTTDWPYRISDPVLKSGPYGSWEFFWVGDPWVILDSQSGHIKIWYTGYYNTRQFGYAIGVMDPLVPPLLFGE